MSLNSNSLIILEGFNSHVEEKRKKIVASKIKKNKKDLKNIQQIKII